jgi:hypothetical protein
MVLRLARVFDVAYHPERRSIQDRSVDLARYAVTVGVLPIGVVGALSRKPWIHAILALLAATAMLIARFTSGLKLGY